MLKMGKKHICNLKSRTLEINGKNIDPLLLSLFNSFTLSVSFYVLLLSCYCIFIFSYFSTFSNFSSLHAIFVSVLHLCPCLSSVSLFINLIFYFLISRMIFVSAVKFIFPSSTLFFLFLFFHLIFSNSHYFFIE